MDTIEKVSPFPSSVLKLHQYYREGLSLSVFSVKVAWTLLGDSAGLLTPLTFARNRLSPLAAFTSGAYSVSSQWYIGTQW